MANHQSSIKRIRQTDKKRLHNRYYAKTARNAVKALRNTLDKAEAQALYEFAQCWISLPRRTLFTRIRLAT